MREENLVDFLNGEVGILESFFDHPQRETDLRTLILFNGFSPEELFYELIVGMF